MALEQITFNIAAFKDSDAAGNNYYAGVVYEVFNINDTLASIFSDSAGANPISQDGISNTSDSTGKALFYIDKGAYYALSGGERRDFETSVSALDLRDENTKYNPPTIQYAIDSAEWDVNGGEVMEVQEYYSGTGGGGKWKTITLGTTAGVDLPNDIDILQLVGVPSLAINLVGRFTFAKLGLQTGTDISTKFQAIIDRIIERGTVKGSRVQVESVGMESGEYLQGSEVNLKNIRDFRFYSVSGGKGSVVIDTTAATISTNTYIAEHAAFGQFENITWKGLVDNDTNLFSIGSGTFLTRSWDFEGCDFIAIKRSFRVSGSFLCSEFSFLNCDFLQCHTLMYNSNVQAVNWNFVNCNWENDSLTFSGDNAESALLYADKGTFLTWNGGSVIPQGSLVFCNWTAAGDAFRASNKVVFNSTRIEIHPTTGSTNPPMVDRTTSGYVTASNSMPVTFNDCTGLIRGGVISPYVWANVWNKSSLTIDASEFAGGEIQGIYDGATETAAGELIINNNVAMAYIDDLAGAKTQNYVNHFVKITHDSSQDSDGFDLDQRNATTIGSSREKIIRVRSNTGRIPLAATETVLPVIPKNATVVSIGYKRLQVANTANSFNAELKSSDGVTSYATVTMLNNERKADSVVLLESGIDIVTDLKVVFTGVAENAFGYFELAYI